VKDFSMLARTKPAENKLTVDLAKRFAWLLRKDLRETFEAPTSVEFDAWWLIKGRIDFPGWAHPVSEADQQLLFSSAGNAALQGVTFEVPQVVHLLARLRPDAVASLSSTRQLGAKPDNERFFAWAIVRGLVEHQLVQYAPRSLLFDLDKPVPQTQGGSVPAATLLMYLVWHLMDASIQKARDIFTPDGRLAFMVWFFGVLPALGLQDLVAGRWRSWLKGQTAFNASELEWLHNPAPTPITSVPNPPKGEKSFGVNIYGFAYGELGIGEDLRMAVECCEAANIPFHVVNVDAGDTRQADMHLKGKVSNVNELPPYNINIFCLPAFDTVSRVFMQKGAVVFEGYRNIGWWPWELSVFPNAWKPYAFELVDEVWASSQFLFDMYKQATEKPVKLVPLAVSVERMNPYPRKHYALPEKKFLFLYIFDFNSSVARKNPIAAVRAFKKAFDPADNTVGLVLKTMNTKPNDPEWLAFLKECQRDSRIQLITETLDRPEVLGLINACDAYVSLHRAEGFGRTLAEAMLLGKPVIATNYSGNVDFLKYGSCYAVKYRLIAMNQHYQFASSSDNLFWADVNLEDSINGFKSIKNKLFKVVPCDKLINFSSLLISQIVMDSLGGFER